MISREEIKEWFRTHPRNLSVFGISKAAEVHNESVTSGAETYFKAATNWKNLIVDAVQNNPQFAVLWREYKQKCKRETSQDYKLSGVSKPKDKDEQLHKAERAHWHLKQRLDTYHKDCSLPGHPIPIQLRLDLYQYASTEILLIKSQEKHSQDELEKLKRGPPTNDERGKLKVTLESNEEKKINEEEQLVLIFHQIHKEKKLVKNLILLEGLYVHLLGPSFRYRMGIQGPGLDLFLWNILQNKRDLSLEMWKHVEYPVRCAIWAAYLFRKMGENSDPITRFKMLENADYFEDQAIAVQNAAQEEDRDQALKSVDCGMFPCAMWCVCACPYICRIEYGVAMISRILKNISLFGRISSLL